MLVPLKGIHLSMLVYAKAIANVLADYMYLDLFPEVCRFKFRKAASYFIQNG